MTCPDDCDCRRVANEQTPEQHLAAALDGMPELAEALASLRQWAAGGVEVPTNVPADLEASYLFGVGRNRADHLLAVIDRAGGQ